MGGGDKDVLPPPTMEEGAAADDISADWHHVTEAEAVPPPSLETPPSPSLETPALPPPDVNDAVVPRENENENEDEEEENEENKEAESVEEAKEKTTITTDHQGQRNLTTTTAKPPPPVTVEGGDNVLRSRVLPTKPVVASVEKAVAKETKKGPKTTTTTTTRSLLVPLCSFLLVFGGTLLMLALLPGFRFSSQAVSPAVQAAASPAGPRSSRPVQPSPKKPEAVVQRPPKKHEAGMKVAYVQHVKTVAVRLEGLLAEKLRTNEFERQRNTMAAQSHQHLLALHTALGKGSAKLLKQMVKGQKKRMVSSLEAATRMLADHSAKTAAHAVEKKRHLFFIVHKAANYDVRDVARLTSTALESVMEDVSNNKMGVKSREVDAAVLQVLESVRRAYLEAITDAYLDSIS